MTELALALRGAARAALPPGAFLRRDRGDALFVSDAPARFPESDWAPALRASGFLLRPQGGLVKLTPGGQWLARLEDRFPAPPEALSAALSRFSGLAAEPESLALFARGARRLDGGDDDPGFERALRQRAAVCLRLNATTDTPHGGGLYACALMNHLLKEAIT